MSQQQIPTVLIVRHPDAANWVSVEGGEVRIEEIDLGGSFNIVNPHEDERPEMEEAADDIERRAESCPPQIAAEMREVAEQIRSAARGE